MSTKLARWRCPKCDEGKLAPRRARRADTRTYCLACSATSPTLVRRVCPAAEAKRVVKREAAKAKARKRYVFRGTDSYYTVQCPDALRDFRVHFRNAGGYTIDFDKIRVRTTKQAGPVAVTSETITFRKGPWIDRHDVAAQAVCAVWKFYAGAVPSKIRLREICLSVHGLHFPNLRSWKDPEVEIALLLRAKAAVEKIHASQGALTFRKVPLGIGPLVSHFMKNIPKEQVAP